MQVLNGSLVTTDATDQEIIPMELNADGDLVPAGRTIFTFSLVSGSVKMGVGTEIDDGDFVHATNSTAGDKWLLTASPSLEQDWHSNLRGKGVATFKIYW
jgi:hypothetical protein